MYQLKTKETDEDVMKFIESVDSLKKREDAYQLLDLFTASTNCQAKMWGTSIIGFGKYHYQYESGHSGEAPLVSFSPRKAKISIYLAADDPNRERLLNDLGKYTTGKSCVYINKVADINQATLSQLINSSMNYLQKKYPV
ncbi:DUF1801 domain-containing protein [Cytobacillus sp. Sa5YUA1]|uniref:DUF1801 domain-containing protein n=1 Tax=Cytobacillus stercorigallinarum TaxID=2762240 RepID=A0ABR8QS82_9BACI|nr:DUF1801 domain-containing protein [Cytobacillus stercorigallinarum]MBD7938379.1 DUF1801 domain-containing protein [Cytobacillus stercorigallinarum]